MLDIKSKLNSLFNVSQNSQCIITKINNAISLPIHNHVHSTGKLNTSIFKRVTCLKKIFWVQSKFLLEPRCPKNILRMCRVRLVSPFPYLPPTLGMTFKNNKVLCYKDFIKTFKDFFQSRQS